jgi:aconitate hydratase
MPKQPESVLDVRGARILALFGDSITTDHISPAGSIKADSPAGRYLQSLNVKPKDFNSYGARRGNHQVMMRGTFANIRIRNEMVPDIEGGMTKHFPSEEVLSIYDAAMRYREENIPLVIVAGKEYGTGSSRDWAAKGPKLQGVSVVIAESFERIHRSNLIGMGILPLEFMSGENRKTLHLKGDERFDFENLASLSPRSEVRATLHRADGSKQSVRFQCRIDTQNELLYYQNGGILHYVLRSILKNKS